LSDGVYTFEEEVTEGLTYGNAFTPAVGKIYNGDATVRVEKLFEGASAIPDNGLIFYMPFNGTDEPVEGSTVNKTGELTYGEQGKIKYAQFDGNQWYVCSATQDSVTDFTMAISFRLDSQPSGWSERYFMQIPNNNGSNDQAGMTMICNSGEMYSYICGHKCGPLAYGVFYSLICTVDSTGRRVAYLDGNIIGDGADGNYASSFNTGKVMMGAWYNQDNSAIWGKHFDYAIWNRALTAEEIAQVASRAASMN
jgi:hypothetical protein